MKKRLDILVYEKGFTDSREKAKAIIMSGQVYVDNQKADKCGTSYDENVKIEVRGNTQKYVSRGGLKLEKAIDNFDFDLKVCDLKTLTLPWKKFVHPNPSNPSLTISHSNKPHSYPQYLKYHSNH